MGWVLVILVLLAWMQINIRFTEIQTNMSYYNSMVHHIKNMVSDVNSKLPSKKGGK